MITYKQLKTCHPQYNADLLLKTDLLYKGGTSLSTHASLFLPAGSEEGEEFYARRCATAYDPIFANVLDRFKSLLFSKPLCVVSSANNAASAKPIDKKLADFLHHFEKNCDGQGTSFHNFCKNAFLTTLKHNHSVCMVDFPRVAEEKRAKTYPDQLNNGELNGYLVDIPLSSIINWQKDEHNNFVWLTIFTATQHRDAPLASLMCLYQWITISLENGVVVFHIYEKDLNLDLQEKLQEEDVIPELPPVITSFQKINIVEMCLSDGLSLGSLLAPMALQLFETDSYINATAIRNTVCLPYYKGGNNLQTANQDGRRGINLIQMDPHRFSSPVAAQQYDGWKLIGKDDEVGILETKGTAVQVLQEQKKIILQRINAAAHQAAQNIQSRSAGQAQSAAAKQEDRKDTEIILNEFKLVVEQFAMQILQLLLHLRGQEMTELHIEGLNVEDEIDRKDVLAEVVAYGNFPSSEIFKVNFEYGHALDLLNDDLSEDDKQQLRQQIMDGVKSSNNLESNRSAGAAPNSNTSADNEPVLTEQGHVMLEAGAHLSTGQHVDARVVHDILSKDYRTKDIEPVLQMSWKDVAAVPLSAVNSTHRDDWQASQPEDQPQVDRFAEQIQAGTFHKPVILYNNPSNNNKMDIVDGHHTFLAYEKLNLPIPAYVGEATGNNPLAGLHGKQVSETSKQVSMQKDMSNQINNSEDGA